MLGILEIAIAVFAVFGVYTLLDMLRFRLVYPRRIRQSLRAAVIADSETEIADTAMYALYLRREKKISPERLIILTNDDIIIENAISGHGDVYRYIKCKEITNDDGNANLGKES